MSLPWLMAWAFFLLMSFVVPARAAQVQHLNTQTATATGAGIAGKPTIASFNIPSGKNRAIFIWAYMERDHCSNADVSGSLCTTTNTAGTGLGDNWPEPRTGTPPSTTTLSQITARLVGPGGTVDKKNALTFGGTPSGDTRFVVISTSPSGSPSGTAFFSVSSFQIVLFEDEINALLGGAASGNVSIALPDVTVPSNAGDDATLVASVFQNVEQTPQGFVRNATAVAQVTTGTPGNSTLSPAAYDAGQVPDEADDGKLVTGVNADIAGFLLPAGHVALVTPSIANPGGNYDTPNGNINNEPNGLSGGLYFRNGGATPGSLYTLQLAGAATTSVYGATSSSFLVESDNADVGDAPISYGNPTHTLNGIRLGANVDADPSLLNSANASGDDANNTDDENGVTLTPLLPAGQTTVVPVSIQGAGGYLSAWFDWNADGDFNDAGEQMVPAQSVSVGTLNLNIAVPTTAVVGSTFARFRVCTNNAATDNCSNPTGTVQSGEVEDYQFIVARSLVLMKRTLGNAGGPFGFTLTKTAQATGNVTTSAAATDTQVDGDTTQTGTQAYSISAPTTAVTITESSLPPGWAVGNVTCTNSSGATVGSRSGASYTITGAEIAASTSFRCTFTNSAPVTVTVTKVSTGGVGSFDFSGTNGFANQQITTTVAGTGVSGPAQTLTTVSTATTITEAAPPSNFTLASINCTGLGAGGSATYTVNGVNGGNVLLDALATAPGSNITCTFTNQSRVADFAITKSSNPADGISVVVGATIQYTLLVTNHGPATATGALVRDTPNAALNCVSSNPVTCTPETGSPASVCPAGPLTIGQLTTAPGIALGTMAATHALTLTFSCTVQ